MHNSLTWKIILEPDLDKEIEYRYEIMEIQMRTHHSTTRPVRTILYELTHSLTLLTQHRQANSNKISDDNILVHCVVV